MAKPIKLSKEAKAVVAQLSAKALEDPNFQRRIDDLLTQTDDKIKEGLATYIKNEFPDDADKNLEAEILGALRQDKKGGGIIDLQKRSRQNSLAGC